MYLIPQVHELMVAFSIAVGWSFLKAGKSRQPLSAIFDVPTDRIGSQPSSAEYLQGDDGGGSGNSVSTTNQASNEGAQSMSWTKHNEKN